MIRLFRSKILISLLMVFLVLLLGVLGYRYITEYTWLDSLYMTIITVTTVGFMEVHPLDHTGKIFTIILIVTSVFIIGFALSVITEYVLSRNSLARLKKKKAKAMINKMENHVIVCGFGRNGKQAAKRLTAYKQDFVVIEYDKEVIEKYSDEYVFVEGDANEDETLREAGIEKAKYLITALPNDATNLFVVLSARQLNKQLFIISRASQLTSQRKLELAGADKVIMPDRIGGDHMASLVVDPDLITFMDHLSMERESTPNLEEVAIEDFGNEGKHSSLRDLDLRRKTGCTIIGYIAPDGTYIINPDADLELHPRSKVIVLGRPEQIRKLNEMFHIERD